MEIDAVIGCESSGVVREAFRKRGINAWSCDLQPADDGSLYHFQCDIRYLMSWCRPRLLIAHPDCTFLASSGLHWNARVHGRAEKTAQALEFVRYLMALPIKHIAIENPKGCIGTQIRPADQYIQPHWFGEDAAKQTGLWLKNLPLLKPTIRHPGRVVMWNARAYQRWSNQTDSGQNKLSPSDDRWKLRAKTYAGIANAFADTWGSHVF